MNFASSADAQEHRRWRAARLQVWEDENAQEYEQVVNVLQKSTHRVLGSGIGLTNTSPCSSDQIYRTRCGGQKLPCAEPVPLKDVPGALMEGRLTQRSKTAVTKNEMARSLEAEIGVIERKLEERESALRNKSAQASRVAEEEIRCAREAQALAEAEDRDAQARLAAADKLCRQAEAAAADAQAQLTDASKTAEETGRERSVALDAVKRELQRLSDLLLAQDSEFQSERAQLHSVFTQSQADVEYQRSVVQRTEARIAGSREDFETRRQLAQQAFENMTVERRSEIERCRLDVEQLRSEASAMAIALAVAEKDAEIARVEVRAAKAALVKTTVMAGAGALPNKTCLGALMQQDDTFAGWRRH